MSIFDDNKRAQENKFVSDQNTEFRIMARRSKLLGFWAAELFGLEGDDAEKYAKSVVLSDLEEAGDDDVFRKLRADFDLHSIHIADNVIRAKMDEMTPIASAQILEG